MTFKWADRDMKDGREQPISLSDGDTLYIERDPQSPLWKIRFAKRKITTELSGLYTEWDEAARAVRKYMEDTTKGQVKLLPHPFLS